MSDLGGNILSTPFHPAPSFPGYSPVPLAAAALDPRQFMPPQIFYWPYPSPPVSPTNYYPTIPPPGALPPQQPQQQMIPPECAPLPQLAPLPIDPRLLAELHRQESEKDSRTNLSHNQYVEIII